MAGREYSQPYRNFRFRLEIDGIQAGGFSEVTGVDASIDVIEYREGTDPRNTPRKLPGLTKYGNITLKWGTTDSMVLYEWLQGVSDGSAVARKNITLTAVGESGDDVATWQMNDAWPVKYVAPDFNGMGSEVAIESLEICFEELKRTK